MGRHKVMLAPMAVAVGGCVRSWPLEVVGVQMVLIIVMLMLTTTVSTTLRRCTMSA